MRVAVAGAGGMGREALAWLRDARPDVDPVAFFVADARERPKGADVDLAVLDSVPRLHEHGVTAVVLGIGDPRIRSRVADELKAADLALMTTVHPTAFLGPGVRAGVGAILAPGCLLTRDVYVGRSAIINFRAAIGHDCVINDFTFVGPGAVLSGTVTIGARALVGAGAVVLAGREIGEDAIVGAGAVVTRDVAPGTVVVGMPAAPLSRDTEP
jgi:sugar O-acyltransferase (sialic acid O-acetyltransferase NeuD family)